MIAAGICILVIGGGTSAVLLHTTGTHSLSGPPQMQQDNGYGDNNGGQFPGDGNQGIQRPDGNMGNDNNGSEAFGHGHNGHGPMDNNDNNGMPPQQDNGTQTPDSDQSMPGNKQQDKQDNNDNDDSSTKETSILTTSVQLNELLTTKTQAPANQPDSNQSFAGPDMGDRSMNGYGMNGHGMMGNDMDHHDMGGHGMHHGSFLMQVLHSNQISLASKIAVLATAVLGFLWLILAWFTIVCYLYQTSTFSRMNPAIWTLLGIIGSVFALIAFFIARSILRIKCAVCGSWQDIGQAYCNACGSKLQRICEACGAAVSQDAAYCASCGAEQQTSTLIKDAKPDDSFASDETAVIDELSDADETDTQNETPFSEGECVEEE